MPVLFQGNNQPESLSEVVGQAVGAASTCWEHMEGTGVFDSDRAKEITDEVLAYIDEHYVAKADADPHAAHDVVDVFKGEDGQWRWHRRAGNNEKVASSGEGFESESGAMRAAHRANPGATVRVSPVVE